MKRIAASVGLVAIGVSTLHTAHSSELQGPKPWSVGVSLRGFYDDNVNGTKDDKVDSTGIEVSPTVGFGMSNDQTSADLSYTYSGKYYDKRPGMTTSDHWDHTHILTGGLDHRFNPRNSIAVKDSFVIGQEPDVLRVLNSPTATFQRLDGDNIRNFGAIALNTEMTDLLGFELGYDNTYFNYDDDGETIDGAGNVLASNSGLLDRIEHRIHVDSRWHFRPETVGILGYQFAQIDYTADELVAGNVITGALESDDRDYRTHSVYLGVEHSFNPDLSGSLRLGGQYADYYGNPDGDNDLTPYVLGSLSYAYAEECSAQLGIQHVLSAADLIGTSTSDFVQNAESTTVYGAIIHRILPKLYGTLMGTYQHSSYNGGGPGIDDESDDFVQVGVDLSYRFTPHLSAHAGYNYDDLNTSVDVREDFSRNRVYLGLTAQY